MKNARHLADGTPSVPIAESLQRLPHSLLSSLHTLSPDSPALANHNDITQVLRERPFPLTAYAINGPLLNGYFCFVQMTFNTPTGALSINDADMGTAVAYATAAASPISRYAAQYGSNSITVQAGYVRRSVTLTGNSFADSDLQAWVRSMPLDTPRSSTCVVILVPPGIRNVYADQMGWGGYHSDAGQAPYIFGYVGQDFTLRDDAGAYALVVSHELAEATVDPNANLSNPEVCDPCGPNCQTVFRDFFDINDNWVTTSQSFPLPAPVAYAIYINGIVQFDSSRPTPACPAPAWACLYAPPAPLGHLVDFWLDSGGWHLADHGLVGSTPIKTAVAAVTYVQDGHQRIDVSFGGENGHLIQYWLDPSGQWQTADRGLVASTPIVTAPSAVAYVQDGHQRELVMFGGENGHLITFWLDPSGQWQTGDNGLLAGTKIVSSPSTVAYVQDGHQRIAVFCQGENGHLITFWLDPSGQWQTADNGLVAGTKIVSSPSAVAYVQDGHQRIAVFCQGENGHLVDLWLDPSGQWQQADHNVLAAHPVAVAFELDGIQRMNVFCQAYGDR
jgi:hypothetical protein